MHSWLGPLLAIAGVAVAVVALVFIGFFHESGRQRLLLERRFDALRA